MPRFSQFSLNNLATCHEDLQVLATEAIEYIDFRVLEGHRSRERQNQLRREGKSQVSFPNSKHNSNPSMAMDIVPWPVDWRPQRFYYFAGRILQIAADLHQLGIISHRVRWGGDWDMDTLVLDQSFFDLGHFELVH